MLTAGTSARPVSILQIGPGYQRTFFKTFKNITLNNIAIKKYMYRYLIAKLS